MSDVADELLALPFFRPAGAPALRRSAVRWREMELPAGGVVWFEGEPASSLAVLISGELEVRIAGATVGTVRGGEMIGEAGVFFARETRSATLMAKTPCRLLAIGAPGIADLRREGSPVYDVLLDQALSVLSRRIRSIDQRIAGLAVGEQPARTRKEPSVLVRMWRALAPGLPDHDPPALELLLRAQPTLGDADDAVIAALAEAFTRQALPTGEVVVLEGEPGAELFVVGAGSVEVVRNVRGDRAELLATLGPGDCFGALTLLEPGNRTASCVTAAPTWLYKLERTALGRLPLEVRRAWRESMAAGMASQIRQANRALREVLPKAASADDPSFRELLHASGYLEGLSVSEARLEKLSFVVDEDMRRNRRR